jgi:hypothetical protein
MHTLRKVWRVIDEPAAIPPARTTQADTFNALTASLERLEQREKTGVVARAGDASRTVEGRRLRGSPVPTCGPERA